MKDLIKIGDIVSVNFHGAQITLCHRCKVVLMPTAVGDTWVFHDEANSSIHYVSEPCTITKRL